MAIRKSVASRAVRGVGKRFNPYSDDDSNTQSELQNVVEKIAEKVDSKPGRVSKGGKDGLVGSLRVTKEKNDWYVEVKTEDGWLRSTQGIFTLKKRNS